MSRKASDARGAAWDAARDGGCGAVVVFMLPDVACAAPHARLGFADSGLFGTDVCTKKSPPGGGLSWVGRLGRDGQVQ